jgi:hypothetical protein|nr:MAG TPA: portal protein [Caudoviricetes sp.]
MAFWNRKKNTEINNGEEQPEPVIISTKKITEKSIMQASTILQTYKRGKTNLENRHIANEQWWKLRQWEMINQNAPEDSNKPASGWLFNCIISKHADYDEAYPTFNCLPREEGDKEEAAKLSSILPVVLEQNRFRDTYSDAGWQKLKFGTAIYGVFWDNEKYNGLGDIAIEKIDSLSIYFEPGITDIQKSRNVFRVQAMDNDLIEQIYPETKGKLGHGALSVKTFITDDVVDAGNKSIVVDWYYHTYSGTKKILQFVRYVDNIVLYATENIPEMAEKGLYDHGMYPFVVDPLFPVERSPFGFGYIDVCKSPQLFIDRLGSAILDSAEFTARPRYFIRDDGSVNEDELMDPSKTLVRCDSNLGTDSLRRIEMDPVSAVNVEIRNNLIEEMKETSGNRDVANGGSVSGVTAASAIAAMQEQSGKTSRDSTQNSYRAYEKIINMCIELIRQFYDVPRQFRIVGQNGMESYVSYSNQNIKPQEQGEAFGTDMGMRLPVFDLEVSSQKANAYTKMSQNELALQFFNLGFFNPQMADMAVMALDMMDFDGKDMLINKISQQGLMYQQLLQTQQMCIQLCQRIDSDEGTNLAEQYSAAVMGSAQEIGVQSQAGSAITQTDDLGNLDTENKIVSDARAQAQAASQPQ